MKIIIFIVLTALLLAACASSKKTVDEDDSVQPSSSMHDESFDPLSLNDNDVVIQKKVVEETVETNQTVSETPETTNVPVKIEMIEVDGFRVQILATNNIESATMVQQTAASQFRALEHKSYLVFESSRYKVRIGDVTTRDEAEEIRDLAKDYGYKGSFIVPSKVTVPKQQ
jgi:PBP1b-binding outer membrane lipoprotein LpoB